MLVHNDDETMPPWPEGWHPDPEPHMCDFLDAEMWLLRRCGHHDGCPE